MNVADVIQAFGGYREAGLLLGVSRSRLCEWERDGIPPKRWRQIEALSHQHCERPFSVAELAETAPTRDAA